MIRARLRWIFASLCYRGEFNADEKSAYGRLFEISSSQISRDQREVLAIIEDAAGEGVVRLERGKLYTEDGEAVLSCIPKRLQVGLEDWLSIMHASRISQNTRPRRSRPSVDVVRAMLEAIDIGCPVEIVYHSRSSVQGRRQTISPHTLVDVADRYHVRAFSHDKGRWSDFVLNRIKWARPLPEKRRIYRKRKDDKDWSTEVTLYIEAIDGERNEAVRKDFGLDGNFQRQVQVSKAISQYLVDPEGAFRHPVSVRLPPKE